MKHSFEDKAFAVGVILLVVTLGLAALMTMPS